MTPTTDRDGNSDTPSPWTRPKFVVSAAIVALIAILGLVLALRGPSRNSPPAPPAAGGATAPLTGAGSTDSSCGLPAGDQTVPRVAPVGTRWQLIGTMAAPTTPATYGPGANTNGVPTCFAHSPTGALYAAINFVATSTAADKALTLIKETGTGLGRNAALAQASHPTSATAGSLQVAGFNILGYTGASASVDLLFRASTDAGAGFVHLTAPLIWDGTWKWSLPPSGNPYEAIQAVPSANGYVPWSGA